jgi:hypothetical protein
VLAGHARVLLASRGDPAIEAWLAGWPTNLETHVTAPAPTITVQHRLPVLEWLPQAARAAPAFSAELCALVAEAAGALAWRQTYSQVDVASGAIEASFLDRYGWCEVIGPRAAILSSHIACGFLLLGPQTCYPSHRHEPEELYLPLSGSADWRQGDGDWRQRPPGTLIQHASFETHAMRTAAAPLLALYIWRGGNVDAKASFLPP